MLRPGSLNIEEFEKEKMIHINNDKHYQEGREIEQE